MYSSISVHLEDEEVFLVKAEESSSIPSMTSTESDIVSMLKKGYSSEEIAAKRGVSKHTVSNQLANLYKKFGVFDRGSLLARIR